MTTTFRAGLALVLLAGFYVLALGMVGALGWLTYLAAVHGTGGAAAKLGWLTAALAFALGVAVWRTLRAPAEQSTDDVTLSREQAPELWATVDELAAVAGTRSPDRLVLDADLNASVSEEARLLGLVGGPRTLTLGVPLLQGLDVSELRAVLGHELGHYSERHTRLGALTYRGRAAVANTVAALDGKASGWVLRQYAKLYVLASQAVNRRQELEADAIAVQVAGRDAAQRAIRRIDALGPAYQFYIGSYATIGWEDGLAPTAKDILSGFPKLVAARAEEIATLSDDDTDRSSVWDSHPSTRRRVESMGRLPQVAVDVDPRPATDLVPGLDDLAPRVAEASIRFGDRERLGWEELVERSVAAAGQREADRVYRGVARVTGRPGAGLTDLLDAVETGRLDELSADLIGNAPAEQRRQLWESWAWEILSSAAVRSGAARWAMSWSGPAALVGADGEPLGLRALVPLVLDPAGVAEARERLAALGVDLASAGPVETTASAAGAEIMGGVANVLVDGSHHDVILLDTGLVLARAPKKTDDGKRRLVELASSGTVTELAARHTFLAYEEIRVATVRRPIPIHAELALHDGRTITLKGKWSSDTLTDDSLEHLAGRVLAYGPAQA